MKQSSQVQALESNSLGPNPGLARPVVWVIYCCVTNYPQTQQLRTHVFLHSSCGCGDCLAGSSGSASLPGSNQGVWPGVAVTSRPHRGMVHLQTHSHGCWQVLVPRGLWPEASLSPWRLLHRAAHTWQLAPSEQVTWEEVGRESVSKADVTVFCNLISKVAAHHFCYILFIRSSSLGPATPLGIHGVNTKGRDQWENLWGCLRH